MVKFLFKRKLKPRILNFAHYIKKEAFFQDFLSSKAIIKLLKFVIIKPALKFI